MSAVRAMHQPPLPERLAALEGHIVAAELADPSTPGAERTVLELLGQADSLLAEVDRGWAAGDRRMATVCATARSQLGEARRRLTPALAPDERDVTLDVARGELRRAVALLRGTFEPEPEGGRPLQTALRLRRLYAAFRRDLAARPTTAGLELGLAHVERALRAMKAHPTFVEVRLADRLQLLEVQLQTLRWLAGPGPADEGLQLHRAVQTLATGLLGINDRELLRSHDARAVEAALAAVAARREPQAATLPALLAALEGREVALDALLAEPPRPPAELRERARPLLERLAAELGVHAAPQPSPA